MKTVLIADDDEFMRLLVRKTLESEGLEIVEARDGREAVQRTEERKPDLLILDWMMPQQSGIDALRAIREKPETTAVPVVMLTAKSQKLDRNLAISLGIRGYLVKPFSPLELMGLVEKVLSDDPGPSA